MTTAAVRVPTAQGTAQAGGGVWLLRVPESRPPATVWAPPPVGVEPPVQPALDLRPPGADQDPPQPRQPALRVHTVRARWTARPRRDLPDAEAWSSSLAVAMVEALHVRRPIAQLNRWLSDEVLADISLRRRRRAGEDDAAVPPVLRSLRIQHPHPAVAEVAAHLLLGRRPLVLAFRLEAWDGRWLCTALELGPRSRPARPGGPPGQGENSSSRPAQV